MSWKNETHSITITMYSDSFALAYNQQVRGTRGPPLPRIPSNPLSFSAHFGGGLFGRAVGR